MRYRLLGRAGLPVSELLLGAMSFGDGGASPAEARRIIDLYGDAGGNVIDTANVYRDGQSESILGDLPHGRRHPPTSPPQQHAVVAAVREVADEIGATPAQVALAWTRSHSAAVHPILGASTAEHLADNLGALDAALSEEQVRRLEAAADFTLGFPNDFLTQTHPGAFGAAGIGLDQGARR